MRHFPFLLRLISIALIIIVIARPQSTHSWEETETKGIDIVLALDISGSMMAQDLLPNRLVAAKRVAANFIIDRPNDNIGLVIFAGESFTQVPLTNDHAILLNMLNEVDFGMIEDGTAIGLGLATSINRLRHSQSESRVVILLTDGANNRGQIAPMTAADLARAEGIRVHTIGVGREGMVPIPMNTPFGVRMQTMESDVDMPTLIEIARMTGGQHFRAEDTEGLARIYDEIDAMERDIIVSQNISRRQELFLRFALWTLGLILIELLLRRTWLRNIP
jgi:Ca-activated chloride channel family protein